MKWIYIMIVLVIAASMLGCVGKKQAETTTETQTPASPGESAATPVATTSEVTQTPAPGEDVFGTYSDLASMDTMSSDMDMQISLSSEI